MTERATPISLWDATAAERDVEREFQPDAQVDVAIVGGGFTGLSTALHAAEAGLSAQVLEAEHIGFGGSGRNAGFVNAGVWLPPKEVKAALGGTYGPRFLTAFSEAPSRVFDLIERYQIRCEATRNGSIHAAHAPSGMKDLEERHRGWVEFGAPVELLSADQMRERTGSPAFHGGLLDHRAGTINPMGYCRGLARAAEAAGAKIATGVRVTGLTRDGARWRIGTDRGDMTAANVVLGTNAYTDALWPGLSKVFTTIHYVQFATTPLGPEAGHILPNREALWDTGRIMRNLRRDASDRLIIGTMGRAIGTKDDGITRRWAGKQLQVLFPDLGPVTFDEAWHGKIAMTPDHLPRIIRLDEGLWTPIGYNGRGITTGTIFGQAMTDLLTGRDASELVMPLADMRPARLGGIVTRLHDMAFTANQVWKGLA